MPSEFPFVTFTDVTMDDAAKLKTMGTTARKDYLARHCMKVDQDVGSFSYEIVADFYLHTYNFCEKQGFDSGKISTLLSIMRLIYTHSMELGLSASEAYNLFKHILLKHSCQRPPFSCGIYGMEEVQVISDYVLDTFFRHYKMYRYVFVCVRDLEVRLCPVEAVKVDNSVNAFQCKTENEVDPRQESIYTLLPQYQPMLDYIFAEERKQEALREQEEKNRLARLAKLTFEERVIGQIARLERDVDEAIQTASPKKEIPSVA